MKNLNDIKKHLHLLSNKQSEILSGTELKSVKGGYKGDPPPYIEA